MQGQLELFIDISCKVFNILLSCPCFLDKPAGRLDRLSISLPREFWIVSRLDKVRLVLDTWSKEGMCWWTVLPHLRVIVQLLLLLFDPISSNH